MSRWDSDFRPRDLLRATDRRRKSRSPSRVRKADDHSFRSRNHEDNSRVSPQRERKRKERSPQGLGRIASRGEAHTGASAATPGEFLGRASAEASLPFSSTRATIIGSGVIGNEERTGSHADLSSLDSSGMLVPRSMVLEDGTVRTFYSLPPDASLNSFNPPADDGLAGRAVPFPVDTAARYGAEPRQAHFDAITGYGANGLRAEESGVTIHDRRWAGATLFNQNDGRMNEYTKGRMYDLPEATLSLREHDSIAWDMKYLEAMHTGARPFRSDESGREGNLRPGSDFLSRGIPLWNRYDGYAERMAERREEETVHGNDFAHKGVSPLLPMIFPLYSEDERRGFLSDERVGHMPSVGTSYRPHKEDSVFGDKDTQLHDSGMGHESAREDEDHIFSDLPEGSLEFKQQVYKAFMYYAKTLNENLEQRNKYEEQGRGGTLLCVVCGRFSKPYADTHSLVMHTFVSRKRGLRAEHLGLRKAICTLMGWSSVIEPGDGKSYQQITVEEAKANKKDLILWPPAIIVHNASAGKTSNGQPKNSAVEDLLKDSGISHEKIKISDGREGAVIVKYQATFSCLNEAERLHHRFATSGHGREDWLKFLDNNNTEEGFRDVAKTQQKKGVLYGYLALASDLEKVDLDFRGHCMVRSRKEIEAILNDSLSGQIL